MLLELGNVTQCLSQRYPLLVVLFSCAYMQVHQNYAEGDGII